MRVRKHPAPEGALRRELGAAEGGLSHVRKHPAPQGALRLLRLGHPGDHLSQVRKHPAPEGALRLKDELGVEAEVRQKVPSTRRCIKTERSCQS